MFSIASLSHTVRGTRLGQTWEKGTSASSRLAFDLQYSPALRIYVLNSNESGRVRKMGLGRVVEAGAITWLLGGGFLMFIIVLLLLRAC